MRHFRRISMYIHQKKNWPQFTWDHQQVAILVAAFRHRQGRLIGRMEHLGFRLQSEAVLENMTLEIIKSNEIEGELLDSDQVRSSIARRLGMKVAGLVPSDKYIDGVTEIIIDATKNYQKIVNEKRLFVWHKALFPIKRNALKKINAGAWRSKKNQPMQVISGSIGKEKIHFEAPSATLVKKEMTKFLKWFNATDEIDPVLKAAVAHLWFITIHPFEDGNGRLARAITELQLTRADGIAQRFYSMSSQIRVERKSYYSILEKTQKGSLDITDWLMWFIACLDKALTAAETILASVQKKSRYWEILSSKSLNKRQHRVINKMIDQFEGKLTSSKWAKLNKCSTDTALRDIQNLIEQNILIKEASGGRSTGYKLKDFES